jgi:DNA-directed RNA polymerase subunit RPC12/RpoP
MRSHWLPTKKYRCTNCDTIWDRSWRSDHGMFCPFCHSHDRNIKILPASKVKQKVWTKETALQIRIVIAEARLKELICKKERYGSVSVTENSRNVEHLSNLCSLKQRLVDEDIKKTACYVAQLCDDLKILVNKEGQKTSVISEQVISCVP